MRYNTLRFAAALLLCCYCMPARAQHNVSGTWNGMLEVQGTKLQLIFHVQDTGGGYKSTMDSPDQQAFGIDIPETRYTGDSLFFSLPAMGIRYGGAVKSSDSVPGVFSQAGMAIPLTLSRTAPAVRPADRPQEPKPPYPYRSEEVTFRNIADSVTLAGTLTLPAEGTRFPAAILISGSGPQNRDEELMGHKPFLVIADYLTRRGIAVLRYDDRGTAGSSGNFAEAIIPDFVRDAEAAVAYLGTRREIDPDRIGLIGHSEGGIVAPLVATGGSDIAFVVLLAGTGVRGDSLLLLQQELIGRASGLSEAQIAGSRRMNRALYDLVIRHENPEVIRDSSGVLLRQEYAALPEPERKGLPDRDTYIMHIQEQLLKPWMLHFIRYDPAPALRRLRCPVLALNGSLDLQVPPRPNLYAIRSAVEEGGNSNIRAVELPGLNHLFQEAETGHVNEYSRISQTFAPAALEEISRWIPR